MTRLLMAAALLGLVVPLPAQDPSGDPGAYIAVSPARIGTTLTVDFGHESFPNHLVILSLADDFGPSNHPQLGPIWLNWQSPSYTVIPYFTDGNGNVTLTLPIPPDPNLFFAAPIYGNSFMADPAMAVST